jgi:hypothetical protein
MAIITIKINHNTRAGKFYINQIHKMAAQYEEFKILYETVNDFEGLVNDYIKKSEEIKILENEKAYLESVYGENIQTENDIIFKKY